MEQQIVSKSKIGKNEDLAMELLNEIIEIIKIEMGLKEQWATMIAIAIVRGMRERLGKRQIYIPGPDRTEVYAAVLREFDGRNAQDLIQKYGLSQATFYRLIAQEARIK